jgi:hypothetical protein
MGLQMTSIAFILTEREVFNSNHSPNSNRFSG